MHGAQASRSCGGMAVDAAAMGIGSGTGVGALSGCAGYRA
jgi:hypothetical protein